MDANVTIFSPIKIGSTDDGITFVGIYEGKMTMRPGFDNKFDFFVLPFYYLEYSTVLLQGKVVSYLMVR